MVSIPAQLLCITAIKYDPEPFRLTDILFFSSEGQSMAMFQPHECPKLAAIVQKFVQFTLVTVCNCFYNAFSKTTAKSMVLFSKPEPFLLAMAVCPPQSYLCFKYFTFQP